MPYLVTSNGGNRHAPVVPIPDQARNEPPLFSLGMPHLSLMQAVDYVAGAYPAAKVDDLVRRGAGDVELVFVLESPHTDELISRYPVAGITGRNALAILSQQARSTETLGGLVKNNIDAGDGRVAILNVSTVPLQEKAFKPHTRIPAPPLNDWKILDAIRDAKRAARVARDPAAQAITSALQGDFLRRMKNVPMSTDCIVAVCGGFAHPFGRALPLTAGQTVVELRHPSNGWWLETTGQYSMNLAIVRHRFFTSTR